MQSLPMATKLPMPVTMKDTEYPRYEENGNSTTAPMRGEHYDAELADGDEAADARDDEGETPGVGADGNAIVLPVVLLVLLRPPTNGVVADGNAADDGAASAGPQTGVAE